MSENNQSKARFGIDFDNPANPKVMVLTIPIAEVAADLENNGYIFMLGFLEDAKGKAIGTMKQLRSNNNHKNILRPAPGLIVK